MKWSGAKPNLGLTRGWSQFFPKELLLEQQFNGMSTCAKLIPQREEEI